MIRPANIQDAAALADLRYAFRAEMRQPLESRDQFLVRCVPWMESRLVSNSTWFCWVAEEGGAVVASLWLSLIEKIPNPGVELEWHAYITSVYVHPASRGRGVARAMLDAAMAFSRERGVDSVILWPSELSRPLYARHGFRQPGDMLEAVLDPGREG
ncbi:MAG: GNAT family N-acetyltransferase [Dehalococcoidia bacterium]|nr:GNAT family N-acetyltransferase [Dehalococcoidia bacterium]